MQRSTQATTSRGAIAALVLLALSAATPIALSQEATEDRFVSSGASDPMYATDADGLVSGLPAGARAVRTITVGPETFVRQTGPDAPAPVSDSFMGRLEQPLVAAPSTASSRDSSRATVNEAETTPPLPGNQAELMGAGDTFVGSLLMTDPLDEVDAVLVPVAAHNTINITIYLLDWNPADPAEFDVNFIFGPNTAAATPAWGSTLQTRIETGTLVSAADIQFVIFMGVPLDGAGDPLSQPVRYALTATVADPEAAGLGPHTFTTDNTTSNQFKWYKLAGGVQNSAIRLQVTPAAGQNLDADIYNTWGPRVESYEPETVPFWLDRLDAGAVDQTETVHMVGGDGIVFILLRTVVGAGQGTLSITASSSIVSDFDNVPSEATEVLEDSVFDTTLHEMEDHWDWYVIPMEQGDSFSVLFSLQGSAATDLFNVSLYDKDLVLLEGMFNTGDGGVFAPPTAPDPNPVASTPIRWTDYPATYSGDYYVLVYPVSTIGAGGYDWGEVLQGDYLLQLTIPNFGPSLLSNIPDITLEEDESMTGYNLTAFFSDPEGDPLQYAAQVTGASATDVAVTLGLGSGLLSIVPSADWSGTFSVDITASDPRTNVGENFAEDVVVVTIHPDNDGPVLDQPLTAMTFDEDTLGPGPGYPNSLRYDDIYHDIDTPWEDLDFSWSGNSEIPLAMDDSGGVGNEVLMVGPVSGWFGEETVTFTITDGEFEVSFETNLKVNHANHLPTVVEGKGTQEVSVKEDLGGAEKVVLINDVRASFFDLDVDDPDYAIMTKDKLTIRLDPSEEQENLNVTLRGERLELVGVTENWVGQESIFLEAFDQLEEPVFVEVVVTTTEVNDPPTITAATPVPTQGSDIVVKEGQRQDFAVTVVDADDFAASLEFQWTLDGFPLLGVSGGTYTFATDRDDNTDIPSAGMYGLRMVVHDPGGLTAEQNWSVEVVNVNQAPEGVAIESPRSGTSVVQGTEVSLKAATATDKDGETLTYRWALVDTAGNSTDLGSGQLLAKSDLPVGSFTLKLTVSDGHSEDDVNATVPLTITKKKVTPKKDGIPGFEAPAVMGALLVVALMALRRQRRDEVA